MATNFKSGTRMLTGDAELDAKLSLLKIGAANKIARPALTKAARILLAKMKQGVPATHKNLKRALGLAVDSKGGRFRNEQRSKVGAGVGKASKAEAKRSGKNKGGIGISGANVHWFLLGTGQRTTDAGANRGSMPAQLPGLIRSATNAAKSEITQTIRNEVTTRLAALAKQGG